MDQSSEAMVYDDPELLMAGRTTLIIAHRASTVAHADRILIIDNGRVAEQGPHRERILNPEGIYGKLYGRMFADLIAGQTGK